ncbi:2-phosphosulfolactate phosphatase family protein [Haloimpatiens massiliensis]|uniref:2-phosphosulfolactate phosphatase family protein n=1 Tax=Haloimpatiens massiliensis TaxID=1658110 RepID=UPI000C82422A|nr:2-phosphosulfolactate phosphatase family protein [Haloimpatiens massiliensis]
MKIDVIISANDIKEEKIKGKTVVVIDMLRATSVITTALNNGCKKVIPVLTVEEAKEIAKNSKDSCILGGERNAVKIDGFDFSNSPLDYKKDVAKDKVLIMTTSNGTRAINACINANNILIGAMLNAKAAAKRVVEINNDLVIVNSGTAGEFSMDDFICGGYIIQCIKDYVNVEMTDIAKTSHYIYECNNNVIDFIKGAKHYNRLKELGLEDDLTYCCSKDIISIVPEYKNGCILNGIPKSKVHENK